MIFDILLILILAFIGIGLIILEVFFIPGIGIAGIGGAILLGGATWFAYDHIGTFTGNITLITSLLLLIISFYWFIKGKILNRISLDKKIDSKAPNEIKNSIVPGEIGITVSQIKPIGTILIGGRTYEAKSEDGFIEVDKSVEVLKVNATSLIVKEIID